MNYGTDRKPTAERVFGHALTAQLFFVLITGLLLLSPVTVQADVLEWPVWTLDEEEDASEHAQAAVVMDAETGAILYEYDADTSYYPASITKIMTALLALENCSLDEVVTFSEDAVYNTEGSSIARDVGEEMTMEECLYGMMLASANECAYAIGEHVAGGSIDDFVEMMNEKAAELGCTNTHFANSSGLPDEDHYVSARDMAIIARAAYENETFMTICGTATYEIAPTNKHDEITYLMNHHNMIYPYSSYKYLKDYVLGGKTGYTEAAGSTLVTYAEQDGMTLICVVLSDTAPNHWLDTISLLEYYFEKCESETVAVESGLEDLFYQTQIEALQEAASFLTLSADSLDVILPAGADASDVTYAVSADETGETAGTVDVLYNGKVVGSVSMEWNDISANDWTAVVALAGSAIPEEEKGTLVVSEDELGNELVILGFLAVLSLLVSVIVKLQERRERRAQERLAAENLSVRERRKQQEALQRREPGKKKKKKKKRGAGVKKKKARETQVQETQVQETQVQETQVQETEVQEAREER